MKLNLMDVVVQMDEWLPFAVDLWIFAVYTLHISGKHTYQKK
jgi:hypothetical protein